MDKFIWFLLGIIIPYLLDFTKPWVRSYWNKGYLSFRERRLYRLRSNFKRVKEVRSWPEIGSFRMIRGLAAGIFYLTVVVFTIGARLFAPEFPFSILFTIFLVSMGIGVLRMNEIFNFYSDVIRFDDFRNKTIEKVKKLGGNPEDLDQAEAEQAQGG